MGIHTLNQRIQHSLPAPRQPEIIEREVNSLLSVHQVEERSAAPERAKNWRLQLAAGILAAGAITTAVYLTECANDYTTPPVATK